VSLFSSLTRVICWSRWVNRQNEPPERRDEMAKAAAPFVHPRLASVDYSSVVPPLTVEEIDIQILELIDRVQQRRLPSS
jgi:hypothetical protein